MSTTTDTVEAAPAEKPKHREISEREARQVAEAARETEWKLPSFVREMYLGRLRMDLIDPFPKSKKDDGERGREFLQKFEAFLKTVDGRALDREPGMPADVHAGLTALGAYGMKIPQEYGGLGLTQRTYTSALALAGSHSSTISSTLSAHQSIGVPQPLVVFGTEEQKRKYLPRLAQGAISGFALTESDVGSDPARMRCEAVLSDDGSEYVLNGTKLWCTNAPLAELLVVMARTPSGDGSPGKITAFIVEMGWDGVEVTHRCSFMGLPGIENGVVSFKNVRIPVENRLLEEGRGLKLALVTLNTGRLAIPVTCAAAGKWCLQVVREWATVRTQWGAPIGKHEAVAHMISSIASDTFAMEAVADLGVALADNGKFDLRLEAAMGKLFNSEVGWRVADQTMQVRGGRGYETAESLEARGEAPIAVEQMLRSMRINRIFEGSSEIMRLFIAREAVDPHLRKAGAVADPDSALGDKAKDAVGLGVHMAGWIGKNLVGWSRKPSYGRYGELSGHIAFADRSSHRLARSIAMAMARYGAKLERRQAVLFRLVDIGAELFAMCASVVQATAKVQANPSDQSPIRLADLFCQRARQRIDDLFDDLFNDTDGDAYRLAQGVLKGEYTWLEKGIFPPPAPEGIER
ncbi:MAG: acyl-CoA dehydrogenase family protein [Gemmatimonadota bacterium]|nr:acyl-CoA dehydrogenase family protein [Gemmatimonadota bacterium]MDH3423986.1 acyl-CoA dehydrogenase family protein [Gemmatimonadota bacterium]